MTVRLDLDRTLRLRAREWSTPLTGKDTQWGDARLRPTTYRAGLYPMEGIEGYDYLRVQGPGRMPVTCLQRRSGERWETWMVDDPLHWYGMRQRVLTLPPGRLLVAGLGLGLFAHHLLERPDITEYVVVEIDPDVVDLMTAYLPDDPRRSIIRGDFYRVIADWSSEWRPDAVLWDLAVGTPEATRGDFYRGFAAVMVAFPETHLSQFGLRNNAQTILG